MTEPPTVNDGVSESVATETVLRLSASLDRGEAEAARRAADREASELTVTGTGPTGIGEYEPLAMLTADGVTRFYAGVDESAVTDLVRAVEDGDPVDLDPFVTVEHDDDETLPVPDDGPLAVGERRLLAKCGWADPVAPDDWPLVSAHVDSETRLTDEIVGRGRGDAAAERPVTETWETVRETDGEPVVVVNAHDTDHRHRSDETLLSGATVAVLDAAATVAELVGATDVVVLVNEESAVRGRVEDAVTAVGDTLPVDLEVTVGPAEYRAGSPTAALEVLEGNDRIEPRLQPPSPASHGLFGRPTAVHSVRTVLQVRAALQRELPELSPPGDSDETATERSGGTATDSAGATPTRLFSVTGDIDDPAVVELPTSGSLASARGAVTPTDGFQMACVGGVLGGLTDTLDYEPTGEALRDAGLGVTGGVEILGESRCPVSEAGERAQFAAEENSGRCVPGREGTQQLTELLRDVYAGKLDAAKITELARVMRRTANCQIGATAPRPVTTALGRFEEQFSNHADGHCRSGTCSDHL